MVLLPVLESTVAGGFDQRVALGQAQILARHFGHHVGEANPWGPAQAVAGLARIAQQRFDLGVHAIDAVDPTGAGDSFDAAFLCGLLENKPLAECARMATAAAALNTAAFGPMEGDISPTTLAQMMARPLV